ncbi:MAG: F0F1 ATP synthase subunit epsilon [Candidatus Levybacteria bacterium]|nr:F0F1 ATP synthase subunit epsilon [Candidatus Levybacteria bacterium]MDZ4228221.1 F0F1 ATP synthase subunit epsilon [Candidatus Levybacteria bacterium]
MNLLLEIVTPEQKVYKDDINEVIVPTVKGEIAILPNHINLLTQINPGELIVKKGTSLQSIAIIGGFLEVNDNKITILADYAVKAQDIEIVRAQEAKKRAEKIMSEKTSDNELKIAEAELIKAILELKVATKHKKRVG